ncbi:alpha/beta hydrolase fold domain-containing protein [Nocardia uniformis]|uniref:Alpha/beta hydrolase fold domain-containing protein n=1 Tax=Nocardia uniformis TaxID=53432 RepID=A0A849BTK4_9NOCA|nr:alpha/beta hydrolase [Nocardia uniformis]NNH68318.1 alpha/beta hydrolase fold domain-containing protein [Nocardia uniformis]
MTGLAVDRQSGTTIPAVSARVNVELASRASARLRVANAVLRRILRPALYCVCVLGESAPLRGDRAFRIANRVDVLAAPLRPARGTRREMVRFADFRAEWLWHRDDPGPDAAERGAILYFHGGGFVAGGLHSHRRHAARIGRAARLPVLNVDYRQLPKGHITDSVDDALTAYRYLLERGRAAESVVFAGDSAGGGLAFMAVLAARARAIALPAAVVAIAPFADLDPSIRNAHPNDRSDSMLSARALAIPAMIGFARDGVLDPAWSPVNHDFTGLPPVLIQVSDIEVLLPDSEALARRCAEAGVPHTLQIWNNAIHVFQAGADLLPDARAAVAEIGAFIRRVIDSRASEFADRTTAA